LNCKTPIEVWNGRPANYDNLREFGALTFALIKKDKLEAHAKKCIFIGYVKGVKVYKLLSLELGEARCFMSRDITFGETQMTEIWKRGRRKSMLRWSLLLWDQII